MAMPTTCISSQVSILSCRLRHVLGLEYGKLCHFVWLANSFLLLRSCLGSLSCPQTWERCLSYVLPEHQLAITIRMVTICWANSNLSNIISFIPLNPMRQPLIISLIYIWETGLENSSNLPQSRSSKDSNPYSLSLDGTFLTPAISEGIEATCILLCLFQWSISSLRVGFYLIHCWFCPWWLAQCLAYVTHSIDTWWMNERMRKQQC